jgi:pimeloyl-ACP methyl ester carboxylesterase
VAYIARPGQYAESGIPDCGPEYWSAKRFSKDVVASMNEAVSQLSINSGSKAINLIGYSGGAAIAILISARRGDVTSLRTIAGNLDHRAVNQYHNVSLLDGSLNPIDFAEKITNIPQRHFVCADDSVVPIFIAESFAGEIGDQRYKSITIVKGASHTFGWQKSWLSLLKFPLYKICCL